jgi:hypothetical protein
VHLEISLFTWCNLSRTESPDSLVDLPSLCPRVRPLTTPTRKPNTTLHPSYNALRFAKPPLPAAPPLRFCSRAHVPTYAFVILFARNVLAQCPLPDLAAPPTSRHARGEGPGRPRGLDRLKGQGPRKSRNHFTRVFGIRGAGLREAREHGSLVMSLSQN